MMTMMIKSLMMMSKTMKSTSIVFYVIVKDNGSLVIRADIILYCPVWAYSYINFYILCQSYWSRCTLRVST